MENQDPEKKDSDRKENFERFKELFLNDVRAMIEREKRILYIKYKTAVVIGYVYKCVILVFVIMIFLPVNKLNLIISLVTLIVFLITYIFSKLFFKYYGRKIR